MNVAPKTEETLVNGEVPRQEINILEHYDPYYDGKDASELVELPRSWACDCIGGENELEFVAYSQLKRRIMQIIGEGRSWSCDCSIFEFVATMFNKELNRLAAADSLKIKYWYDKIVGFDSAAKLIGDSKCVLYSKRATYKPLFPNYIAISSCSPFDAIMSILPSAMCRMHRNFYAGCSLPVFFTEPFDPNPLSLEI